ncbi:unnamed protein product [Allacma fusca]|uniref:Uncharacterized protein n=1 Tax=Allacma fusca TaxID=39272 RepID=A0A8J2KEP0_9HEXA|nr:unnamed protein product [Allacma fusca]
MFSSRTNLHVYERTDGSLKTSNTAEMENIVKTIDTSEGIKSLRSKNISEILNCPECDEVSKPGLVQLPKTC